ncbi:hypothetical protein RJT34_10001 [Clitoria ternatea]|uniref:Uncharacterized protein n=1 Tax=Clitoria ternatea TaxID=43366 RepID=A0AAN9PVF4_CLITE
MLGNDNSQDKPVLLPLTGLAELWLALKAFTDQKRRFFPHLDDGLETNESASKKHCGSEEIPEDPKEEISFIRTLPDVLKSLEKDVPNLNILTFERLDWLKRASTLTLSTNESSPEQNYHGSNKLKLGSVGTVAAEKVAVIEFLFPSVFRAVISLHPVGSMDPDTVAFFSPDESGSYVHARGFSVHHVFRHITDYAATALQYFLVNQAETALYSLLLPDFVFKTMQEIDERMMYKHDESGRIYSPKMVQFESYCRGPRNVIVMVYDDVLIATHDWTTQQFRSVDFTYFIDEGLRSTAVL